MIITQVEAYAGTMYDAVLLYALAVNETLESGKNIRNGLEVSKRTYNRVYQGIRIISFFLPRCLQYVFIGDAPTINV